MIVLRRQREPCLQCNRRDPNIILRDGRSFLRKLRCDASVDKWGFLVWQQNIDGIQE